MKRKKATRRRMWRANVALLSMQKGSFSAWRKSGSKDEQQGLSKRLKERKEATRSTTSGQQQRCPTKLDFGARKRMSRKMQRPSYLQSMLCLAK